MKSTNTQTIYWSLLQHDSWNLYMAATSKGLCFVGSQNEPFEELAEWTKKRFPGSSLIED
jgi:methylated-DNA-[protein]-cysteine S-methyltransferase